MSVDGRIQLTCCIIEDNKARPSGQQKVKSILFKELPWLLTNIACKTDAAGACRIYFRVVLTIAENLPLALRTNQYIGYVIIYKSPFKDLLATSAS